MGPLIATNENDRPDNIVRFFHVFLIIIATIGLSYFSIYFIFKGFNNFVERKQRRTQTTTGFGVSGQNTINNNNI